MKTIALVGPTASGKTALSLLLARYCHAEIICCDSMQVYRGMDIGTATPTKEEMGEIPHHMLSFLSPETTFSAADYALMAEQVAREVTERGHLPLFCGGTGLYLEAVRTARHEGDSTAPSPALRATLNEAFEREGAEALWERLRALDPAAADTIHPHNTHRVIRALEICLSTGKSKTEHDAEAKKKNPDIDMLIFGIRFEDRHLLHDRIARRVHMMMDEGLLEEVRTLDRAGLLCEGSTAYGAIGYKELLAYLHGECDLQDAVEQMIVHTRQYAKRQMTWFRRTEGLHWLTADRDGHIRESSELFEDARPMIDEFLADERI